jgi:hypothetical protein
MRYRVMDAVSKSLVEYGFPDCTPSVVEEIASLIEGGKDPEDLGAWENTNYGVLAAFVWNQLKLAYERRLIPKNEVVRAFLKEEGI